MKGGNVMVDSPLITKSKEFALQIIKVCNDVKQEKKESVLTNQLRCCFLRFILFGLLYGPIIL